MKHGGVAGFGEERTNEIDMPYAHQLAIFLFKILQIDDRKRFEEASEATVEPFRSFRDAAHDSVDLGKKNYNSICFCEVVAFEDETFAFVYRHPLRNKIQDPGYQKTDTDELQEAFS